MGRSTVRVVTAIAGVLAVGAGTATATTADLDGPTESAAVTGDATDAGSLPGPDSDVLGEQEGADVGIAGECGDTFSVEIDGAEAFWAIHCNYPPEIRTVKGWVKDTSPDARVASLKFTDGGARLLEHYQARGWGESTTFEFSPSASETRVDGRLQLSW